MNKLKKYKKSKTGNDELTLTNKQDEKLTMLSAIETILKTSEDSTLSPECLEQLKPTFEYISEL